MAFRDRLRALFQAPPTPPVQVTPADLTKELARSDIRQSQWFGPISRYNPDDLVGRKGLQIYDEMRRDEQIKACLSLKTAAVVGPGWTLTPQNNDDTGEQDLADQLTEDLLTLPGTFEDILLQQLTALPFGFSIAESVYEDAGDRLALQAVKPRAPFGFWFECDPYGNLLGLRQDWGMGVGQVMPPGKFIIFTHDFEWGNYYGRSDLWAAHKLWFIKRVFLQSWAAFTERYGQPPAVAKYPKGTGSPLIAEMQKIIRNLQANTAITMGTEWDLSLLQTTHTPREFFINSIDRLDLGIARAILVPEKLGLAGGEVTGGSYSLSRVQLGAFFFILNLLKNRTEAAINEQLIRPMAQFAAPDVPPPQFKLNPLSEENKEAIADQWNKLIVGGSIEPIAADQVHLRQMLGFPELGDQEEQQIEALLARKRAQAAVPPPNPRPPNGNPPGSPPEGTPPNAKPPEPPIPPKGGPASPEGMSERVDCIIRKQGRHYVLYTHDGSRVLGRHGSRAAALRQERAIQARKHGMAAVVGFLPTPSQADIPVASKFWRKLTRLEERADMAAQKRLLDDGSHELAGILTDNVEAVIREVKARAESALASKSPEAITAMNVSDQKRASIFADAYASLLRSYGLGAQKARREVQK